MSKPVDRLRLNQTLARYLKPRPLPREHTPLRSNRAAALVKAAGRAGFPEIADRAAQLEVQAGVANDAGIAALLADLDWLHTRLRAVCESGSPAQEQRGAM